MLRNGRHPQPFPPLVAAIAAANDPHAPVPAGVLTCPRPKSPLRAPGRSSDDARRVGAAFVARNIEFVRDRNRAGWNLVMPVLIVLGFAFGYSGEPAPQQFKVGVFQ